MCGVTICDNMNSQTTINDSIINQVLTAEEVAEYLRIHPYTVRRLVRTGKLPGFKVGGQWSFKKEACS